MKTRIVAAVDRCAETVPRGSNPVYSGQCKRAKMKGSDKCAHHDDDRVTVREGLRLANTILARKNTGYPF